MLDSLYLPSKLTIIVPIITEYYSNITLISIIYRVPTINFTLYIVVYLLLTLFAVVSITGRSLGPLRLSTYDNTNP